MALEMFFAVASAFDPGRWVTNSATRRFPEQETVGGIGQSAQFDPCDIAQAHGAAVATCLDHDILELPDNPSGGR